MAKDPAFLFYPNDYIGGTMGMTFEEKGAYMELLMMQFNRGHMTSHMAGQVVGQLWDKIKDKFEMDDQGKFYNKRLDAEIEKRQTFIKSRFNNIKGRNQYNKKEEETAGHMGGHMTSHMENENENINRDLNGFKKKEECEKKKDFKIQTKKPNYAVTFDKALKEMNIQLPEGFSELILEWLKYKAEKGQPYKQTGIKNLIIKLMNDSGGDYDTARAMIFYSVSNNYAGLFKEKANGTGKTIAPATDIEIADILLKHFGDE